MITKGKEKGKTSTVLKAIPAEDKVVIEGVNVRTIHQKPRIKGEEGKIVKMEKPIQASNCSVVDPKTKKPTRVGYLMKDGKKVRIAKKSNTELKNK